MSHTIFKIQNCLSGSLYVDVPQAQQSADIIQSNDDTSDTQEWFLKFFDAVGEN
jgi:hypothetical protein